MDPKHDERLPDYKLEPPEDRESGNPLFTEDATDEDFEAEHMERMRAS